MNIPFYIWLILMNILATLISAYINIFTCIVMNYVSILLSMYIGIEWLYKIYECLASINIGKQFSKGNVPIYTPTICVYESSIASLPLRNVSVLLYFSHSSEYRGVFYCFIFLFFR